MRLLCTGDVHLGRPLGRIPAWFRNGLVSSTEAWLEIVDLAINEHVDAVIISGDLVDQANRYYEAIGPVETGLRKLASANIPVIAVAGNHDHDSLPRIADRLGELVHLLGRNGSWERWTLRDHQGAARLHIDGWSFPDEHVMEKPLERYSLPQVTDAPILGVIHGDLDVAGSRYAPVSRRALLDLPPQAWLLGHIHVPTALEQLGERAILYPGSPFALDPGEAGVHGVVFLEIDDDRIFHWSRRAVAPVRYQSLAIHLNDVTDLRDATNQIETQLSAQIQAILDHPDGKQLKLLLIRLTISGQLPAGCDLTTSLQEMVSLFKHSHPEREAEACLEFATDRTSIAVDLQMIASGIDAPSAVARMLLALGNPDSDERKRLIGDARVSAATISGGTHHRVLNEEPPTDLELAAILEREAWRLLNALLASRSMN